MHSSSLGFLSRRINSHSIQRIGTRWLSAMVLLCGALGAQEPDAPPETPKSTPTLTSTPPTAEESGSAVRLEGHSMHGQAFDEGPRQEAVLLPGMGDIHFPIATAVPDAQRFFEQGIGQFQGFWFFEAERSFRQAAFLDPECAMAYWGMSLANFDLEKNQGRARAFAAEALRRRENASERDQRWIDAWGAYYELDVKELPAPRPAHSVEDWKSKRSDKDRRRDLVRAIEGIIRAEPADIEAKAFLAVLIWFNSAHGWPISSHQPIHMLLDQVFAARALHPAHHFRIHLWDNEKSELALESAVRSGPSAPGIAHMWHMGGHIFDKQMRPREASWLQEASSRVDHAAMARDHVMPFLIHNYGHNQEWLSRSFMQRGCRSEALRIAMNLVELPRHPRWNDPSKTRTIASYAEQRLLDVVERFEDWALLEALAASGHLRFGAGERVDQARAYGLQGRAAAQRGDLAGAEVARLAIVAVHDAERAARLEKAGAAESKLRAEGADEEKIHEAMKKALRDNVGDQRAIESSLALLEAWTAFANNDRAAARRHFDRAKPSSPWQEVDFLIAIAAFDDALKALDKALEKARGDASLHARRVLVLAALERDMELPAAFDLLASAARDAELEAPLLRRLGSIAEQLSRPKDWRVATEWPADFERPVELGTLGPLTWMPYMSAPARIWDAEGKQYDIDEWRGKPVLLVFYLGFSCLHCVEQLQALKPIADRFRAAGIQILAIGTDEVHELREEQEALEAADRFPFPLFADPDRISFRAWQAYDDFELEPLHGTFLIDAEGRVRWQDVGAEPFLELEFLLAESKRLLQLEIHADR